MDHRFKDKFEILYILHRITTDIQNTLILNYDRNYFGNCFFNTARIEIRINSINFFKCF